MHHLISRVLHGEFRIGETERAEYLRRVPKAIEWTDWLLLAYAIMSNHIHWAKFAALAPLSKFFSSIHSGFAHSVNDADRRSGPFFAGRPADWIIKPAAIATTIAYIHNNPVRAQVVSSPEESTWTSHRAFIGLEPAPPWLDVEFALMICGYDATPTGRAAFHDFVVSEIDRPRDERLSDPHLRSSRASARRAMGGPVELGTAVIDEVRELEVPVLAPQGALLRPRWHGRLEDLLQAVADDVGVPVSAIKSGDRRREQAHARRIVIHVGRSQLGLSLTEVAAAVGLSPGAACNLVSRYAGDHDALASRVLDLGNRLWARISQTEGE